MWTLLYVFFASTLVLCALAIRYIPGLTGAMYSLAHGLTPKAFPSNSALEHNKFALLRILFGLVLFIRGLDVYLLLLNSERLSPVGLWAGAEMLAGVFLAAGLLSQWVLLFLVGAMWQYGDLLIGKSTLGNDIGAILAVLLLLVNAGKYLSLDGILIKRLSFARRVLLYYSGAPSDIIIFYAKLIAVASYWAICVYSVAIHLNEPSWMDGSAGPLLLSNNFMAAPHQFFSSLFASSELSVALAKASLWMMMIWYPLVLPFVLLGGVFRLYIIVWGWLFFGLSLFVLQLGYLAEIEILLWLALFWSSFGMSRTQSLEVLYDDRCNLCDKTVQAITLLDIFGRVTLRPLSKNQQLLDKLNIDLNEAMTDLYGVRSDDQTQFRGYDFYIQLSRTLVLLWPLLPFLLLARFLRIGPKIYRIIAERRVKLFGVCELPRQKTTRPLDLQRSSSRVPLAVALHVGVLIIFYFVAVPTPYLGWQGLPNIGARAAHVYGITPIDVFNKTDLRMAENWFALSSVDFDEIVPVLAEDGSRLAMHRSDKIYFGHTLYFRRSVIDEQICQFDTWRPTFEYLSRIYLQEKEAMDGEYRFTYRQFYQPVVTAEDLRKNQYKQSSAKRICELNYRMSYKNE